MKVTIFVADDEPAIRSAIVKRLSRKQHRVVGYESGDALLAALGHEVPDLVLLDLKMPGLSGLETLKKLHVVAPQVLVILLTAYGTVQDAVDAMKLGAYDFLIKTVELDGMDPVVDRAVDLLGLRRRLDMEKEQLGSQYGLSNLVAHSPAMQQILLQVQSITANAKSNVLLLGETGTGKEFLARVLHCNGPRAAGPFVGVNCTAIPKELFESELFGYERGAFTGAGQRKLGLVEKAEGGTLFLDEIGDLDLSMQAKLLRILQERSFRRLGGTTDIEADFRLIAATNRDLKKAVADGLFREDLYFRLNVVSIELPPLRKRAEDILPLCQRALVRYGQEFGKDVLEIDPEASHMLQGYPYPGNIRELHNIIERALIFCQGRTLTLDSLPAELCEQTKRVTVATGTGPDPMIRVETKLGRQALASVERALIEEVLRFTGYNKSLAAKHLGLTRFALERRLKKMSDG
jgi:two-component system, NtrC family, response regulator AtoC